MTGRNSMALLLAVTAVLAALSRLPGVSARWTPDEAEIATAGSASGAAVETTAFAVG